MMARTATHEMTVEDVAALYTMQCIEVAELMHAPSMQGVHAPTTMSVYMALCEKYKCLVSDIYLQFLDDYAAFSINAVGGGRLAENTDPPVLDFSRGYIGHTIPWLPIAATLPYCPYVEVLCFRGQQLTSFMAILLTTSLLQLPYLHRIDLSDNPIGSEAAQVLLKVANTCPSLLECCIDPGCVAPFLYRRLDDAVTRNQLSNRAHCHEC